jgi:uncharacterized protein YecE (DUF72 family)
MLLVGCSGFPIPATRYFREFVLIEVVETFVSPPGPALVRRWKREAPPGFVFTALAPRDLTADAFKPSAAADAAWEAFLPIVHDLGAVAIAITSPPDVPAGKVARAAARALLERVVSPKLPRLVWEPPPSWELRDAEAVAKDLPIVVARDPARHPPFAKAKFAYYRLPGPAGHKSRYEDAMLEGAARSVRETTADETMVVFANVDRHADAKRLRKLVE